MNRHRSRTAIFLCCAVFACVGISGTTKEDKTVEPVVPPPIKALLVTGGCSHDYDTRKKILVQGIRERIKRPIEWVVRHQAGEESDVKIPLFESANWADGYDIVVHDYCFPRVRDTAYVDRILAPHRAGRPAVLIHGTMHSFRTGDDRWFDFCGVTSHRHGLETALPVIMLNPENPITKGIPAWEVAKGQLYFIEKIGKGVTGLTQSLDPEGNANLTSWSHLYGPQNAKVFATSIGNEISTMITPSYLDLIARGFLWALQDLQEANFVVVPPDQSLRGLMIPTPQPLPPSPGWNDAIGGEATALGSLGGEEYAPNRAVDGKLYTAWLSDQPGPASWQVTLKKDTEIGAFATVWSQGAPPEFLLEGADGDGLWKPLAHRTKLASSDEFSVMGFPKTQVSRVRLSIPRTDPGYTASIREFAVYPDLENIPSALLAALPQADPELPVLLTVGKKGIARNVRLAPGWVLQATRELPTDASLAEMIPTASGSMFLLSEPAPESGRRNLFLLGKDGTLSPFLSDLPTRTNIAWDGEWLYTLSDLVLVAYRDTNRDGIADEKRRIGVILKSDKSSQIMFSRIRLEPDGWIYAEGVQGLTGDRSVDGRGGLSLQKGDTIRFRLDGKSVERVDSVFRRESDPTAFQYQGKTVAEVDFLRFSRAIGDQFWFLSREEGEQSLSVIARAGEENVITVDWDGMTAVELPAYLTSPSEVVRREAGFEILRRKRSPVAELESMVEQNPGPDVFTGIVETLAALTGARSLNVLLRAASSEDPKIQILAFRALAGRPDAANHSVFEAITKTTDPAVSGEILNAILATGTEIKGLNDLVLSFTAHPDKRLAEVARNFLIAREAVSSCFQAIDDPARERDWPGAFDVLVRLPRPTVTEGIVLRLEQTDSPLHRALGLEALCQIYRAEGTPREGAGIIEPFLHASLYDYRVDRAELLRNMDRFGVPLRDPESLVPLARTNIALEAFVIATLSKGNSPVGVESRNWLAGLFKSEDRDSGLRLRALGLLSRDSMPETYLATLLQVAKALTMVAPSDAVEFLRVCWLSRKDHSQQIPALLTQAGGGNDRVGLLAWETILTTRDQASMSEVGKDQVDEAISAAVSGGGMALQRLLSSLAKTHYSGTGPILKSAASRSGEDLLFTIQEIGQTIGINPRTGLPLGPPVGDMLPEAVIQQVTSGKGDPISGNQIFRSLACAACHNVHGEGPASAPDLATAFREGETVSLVKSMMNPHQNGTHEETSFLFELKDGTRRAGTVRSRSQGEIKIRDSAGNEFGIDPNDVHLEWETHHSTARCDLSTTLPIQGFVDLFEYLRSLRL